jgi:hypothetical protein
MRPSPSIALPADPDAIISQEFYDRGRLSSPGLADYSEVIASFTAQRSMLVDTVPGALGHARFRCEHGLREPPNDISVLKVEANYAIEWEQLSLQTGQSAFRRCREDDTLVNNLRYSPVPDMKYRNTWASGLVHVQAAYPQFDKTYTYFSIAFSCYPWVSVVQLDSTGKAWISSMQEGGVILSAHAQWPSNVITSGVGRLDCNIGLWNALGVNLSRGIGSVGGRIKQGTAPDGSAGNAYLWGYPTHVVREIFVSSSAGLDDGERFCTVTAWCGPNIEQPVTVRVVSKLLDRPARTQSGNVLTGEAHPAP